MKHVTILTLFLSVMTSQLYSQEKEPEYAPIDWKVGTEKTITQIDSTIIYAADSIYMKTGVSSAYSMEISSENDTAYVVLFKKMVLNEDFLLESDMFETAPMKALFLTLIQELQEKMEGFEYSFLVDNYTAQAVEVLNQEEIMKLIEEVVAIALKKVIDMANITITDQEQKDIKAKVSELMEEQMPAAMQTMLNTFNYIFQAYTFPYILNDKYEMEMMTYDVDAIKHGDVETPVNFTIYGTQNKSTLNIEYIYGYDKEVAYQQYVINNGRSESVSRDEFELDERVKATFDLNTTWITRSLSLIKVIMGDMKVVKMTNVSIK